MKIAVLKELAEGETRVAATPETVKKFIKLGASMAIETGAGESASISDTDYEAEGASVAGREAAIKDADILLGVQGPDPKSLKGVKKGAWLAASLNPFGERGRVDEYAKLGIEALAMEFMPRITRAQSMDILSSQSNLSGYKAVVSGGSRIWPRLSDDDDRCGNGQCREMFCHGCWRCGPSGDCDGAATGCASFGDRCAARNRRAD